ncbi:hypothetical protein TPDSLph2_CDS0034 [Terrisporobacter phage TPDSL_ph2]
MYNVSTTIAKFSILVLSNILIFSIISICL